VITFKCSVILDYSFPLERTVQFSLIGDELIFENEDDKRQVNREIRFSKLKQICRCLAIDEKKFTLGIVVIRNE